MPSPSIGSDKKPRLSSSSRLTENPFITGLAIALISAGSAFGGSWLSSETSLKVANAQMEHASLQKAKEQRDSTYRAYLDAANEYRNAAVYMFGPTAPADPKAAFSRFMTARHDYQTQVNEVSVYGSREAWIAHKAVAATLPHSLGSSDLSFKATDVGDAKDFTSAYQEFLSVRCSEVTAVASGDC